MQKPVDLPFGPFPGLLPVTTLSGTVLKEVMDFMAADAGF